MSQSIISELTCGIDLSNESEEKLEDLYFIFRDERHPQFDLEYCGGGYSDPGKPIFSFTADKLSHDMNDVPSVVKQIDKLSTPAQSVLEKAKQFFEEHDLTWSEPTWFYSVTSC